MTDIVKMTDRKVRDIIERKKQIKNATAQTRAWKEIKRRKSGGVPPEMVMGRPAVNAKDFLPDNAWKDRRCFIIGGGPSLRGFNFDRLGHELTIAVNRAFEYINPSIILWMDYQTFYLDLLAGKFGDEALKKFESTHSSKVALNISGYDYPDEVYSIPRAAGQGPLSTSLKDGLVDGDNIGYTALNLAVCLGANPIYLLGFDMRGDGKGKQSWFHSGYKTGGSDKVYGRFTGNFKKTVPVLKERGIDVINLNQKSKMKCFPFGDINEIRPSVKRSRERKHLIGKSDRKWIVISFYTRDTPYEEEFKKLVTSLMQHNLPFHIYSYEPMGSWRANLNHKSACIVKAMETYPDHDIVFIDADGIVRQNPVLFDQLSNDHKHNMAAVFHTYAPVSGDPDELLSGTLWLANNGLTRGLIKLWHKIAVENPLEIHQRCLKYAIKEMEQNKNPVKIFRMPWEYTCIFDYVRSRSTKPVIEHFQASRRFREKVGYGDPLIKGIQT